jgi:IS605 OrfB family transposase
MSDSSSRTYQTRTQNSFDDPLDAYADLMAHVEHSLFREMAAGKTPSDLKSSYLTSFHITARQFNATRVKLEGTIDSILQLLSQRIETKKNQIEALEETIARLKNKKILHQKKRRLSRLRSQLRQLEVAQKNKKVALCFGSRKLFRAQFDLAANGYKTHEEWKASWKQARASQIFILGSKDETAGNQSCTATIAQDGSIALRVRLPDALVTRFGKYQQIPGIRFAYGHDAVVAAIRDCQLRQQLLSLKNPDYKNHGQAITFRFKKDSKSWRIFVTIDTKLPQPITHKGNGVVGVDINSGHLAVVETDRFGNPIHTLSIPLHLNGLSKDQAKALVGDVSAKIIAHCEKARKPLVLENLDFKKKKAQLREKNPSYCRMLSGFAYGLIIAQLKSRGQSKGIGVHAVNPAYTSLIGRVNFAERYGLTVHLAAALCIGRRFLGVSEKMPQGQRDIPDGKGGHVTLDLPVRNRSRHVWSQWGQLNKKLSAALTVHFRAVPTDPRAPQNGSCDSDAFSDLVGGTPARESSTQLLCWRV